MRGIGLFLLAIVIGVALGFTGYSLASDSNDSQVVNADFTNCFTNDDGVVNNPSLDPNDDGTDPGKDKDTAGCFVYFDDKNLAIEIINAYPSYECVIYMTITNGGTGEETLSYVELTCPGHESELTIQSYGLEGVTLGVGESVTGSFTVHVEDSAIENTSYVLQGMIGIE